MFLKQIPSVLLIVGMQFYTGEVNNTKSLHQIQDVCYWIQCIKRISRSRRIVNQKHNIQSVTPSMAMTQVQSMTQESPWLLRYEAFCKKRKCLQDLRISTADFEKTNFIRNFSESLCFRNNRPLKFIPVTSSTTTSSSVSKYYWNFNNYRTCSAWLVTTGSSSKRNFRSLVGCSVK